MNCMEFVAMLSMVLFAFSTTLPICSSIRSSSKSVVQNQTAHSEPIPAILTTKPKPTSFRFPLLHRNHPEIERQFGSIKQLPLEVAPTAKNKTKGLYYVNFLVGSEKESIFAIFDTGSGFTWMQHRMKSSSTYKSLPCHDENCRDAPDNSCHGSADQCLFQVRYVGSSTSSGVVGRDDFHFFDPAEPGSTIGVSMVFGTASEKTDYPGVMGVTGGA